jgi:hypothetical protein
MKGRSFFRAAGIRRRALPLAAACRPVAQRVAAPAPETTGDWTAASITIEVPE